MKEYEYDALIKPETIREKVARRDEQAKIILEIMELAKKLKINSMYKLGDIIRHPTLIDDRSVEDMRKEVDIQFWRETFKESQIEKYITSVDKEKTLQNIEDKAPIFDFENVSSTILGLHSSKEATATTLIKKVYENVTNIVFRLGNKSNTPSQRRIQKAIPKNFRATVFYGLKGELPSYVSSRSSNFELIDDLERACYLCDDKLQPDYQNSIRSSTDSMLRDGLDEVSNAYFHMKFYKNGNVKITFINQEVLNTLNKWGRSGNRLE